MGCVAVLDCDTQIGGTMHRHCLALFFDEAINLVQRRLVLDGKLLFERLGVRGDLGSHLFFLGLNIFVHLLDQRIRFRLCLFPALCGTEHLFGLPTRLLGFASNLQRLHKGDRVVVWVRILVVIVCVWCEVDPACRATQARIVDKVICDTLTTEDVSTLEMDRFAVDWGHADDAVVIRIEGVVRRIGVKRPVGNGACCNGACRRSVDLGG